MLVECMVIFGLIFVVMIMYVRTEKKQYALATVPLLILPFANIVAYFISDALALILPWEKFTAYAAVNIVAVIVSSMLIGRFTLKFKRKSTRAAYVVMSLVFNIVLASILVYNMFEVIYRK